MAASPLPADGHSSSPEKWNAMDTDSAMGPQGDANGAADDRHPPAAQGSDNPDYVRAGSAVGDAADASGNKSEVSYRGEKQVKPNKVYIGGLPEHTRKEDLESCFGKIGNIVNIELKVGYGFVEFDNREAAEESVAKYHEGYFMGNKIRVEPSRGGGKTAKYSGDPGACFKCGHMGHWARECPNHTPTTGRRGEPPLIDRIQPTRDYPPPPRDYPPYRDDFGRFPPPRDARYPYDYPPPPPPGRDYRRPPTPPRGDFRDYPPPPAARPARDDFEYRARGPPPPPVPPPRYDTRPGFYPPETDVPPAYPPRGYPPPARDYYDRYDRRSGAPPPPPPPGDRYGSYPAAAAGRPRTPPGGPPPRPRDDFERPPRDYPPSSEFRGRPASPPPPSSSRYADYPPARNGGSDAGSRYSRRRSQSPPPRAASGAYDSGYPSGSGGAPYAGGSSGSFAGNGYSGGGAGAPRGSGSGRDYPPRGGRDGEPSSYSRRP